MSFVSLPSVLSVYHTGGQTRDVDPMLGYCWPTVYGAEPTLAQYCMGYRVVFDATLNVGQRHRRRANINPAFVQSIVRVLQPAWNRPTDYGWMDTSKHRRRWPNIYQTFGRCRLEMPDPQPANTRRWNSAGFMLGQPRRRWAKIGPALGQRLVFAGSVDTSHLCFEHHRVWR